MSRDEWITTEHEPARDLVDPVERAPSFLALLRVHERLNELFLRHQEALLEQDIARARERLAVYEQELLAHMRPEEDILLPVYARAGAIPGGPIELFLGEHRKMREFLERFRMALAELEAHPADRRRRILRLFDEQTMFKHLVEHHDLRERNILYPTLDRITTEAERRELLRRCLDATLNAWTYNEHRRSVSMPGPIEILTHEHRIIERALRALRGVCQRLEHGASVPADVLAQLVRFIQTFADRCHHGKEEKHLFPTLQEHGVPREGGPIGVMLQEHELGRGFVREMAEAASAYERGESDATSRFVSAAQSYLDLLAQHIYKEDHVLFPIAENVLDASTKAALVEAFEREEAALGLGTHEQYEATASELEKAWAT